METQQHHEIMIEQLTKLFVKHIPFHQHIGMELIDSDHDTLKIKVNMSDNLIGNSISNILHGGVIATLLDAIGGLEAFVGVIKKLDSFPTEEQVEQLSKGATIDLRVDYLRPGSGEYFIASAEILRTGNKVTVTRMSLHNDEDKLIAVGSGTYLIAL